MKITKLFFVGALVVAMGFGAMLAPVIGNAEDDMSNILQAPLLNVNQDGQALQAGYRVGKYFDRSMHGTLTEILGLSDEELYQLRASGKSIEQIANDKGISTEQLLEKMIKARTEQLDKLVKDGKITEEQKATMLEKMEESMKEAIKRTEMGPKEGKGREFKGKGPRSGQGQGRGPSGERNN